MIMFSTDSNRHEHEDDGPDRTMDADDEAQRYEEAARDAELAGDRRRRRT